MFQSNFTDKFIKNKIFIFLIATLVYLFVLFYSSTLKSNMDINVAFIDNTKVVLANNTKHNRYSFVDIYPYDAFIFNNGNLTKLKKEHVIYEDLKEIHKEHLNIGKNENSRTFLINITTLLYVFILFNISLKMNLSLNFFAKRKLFNFCIYLGYLFTIMFLSILSYLSYIGYIPSVLFKPNLYYIFMIFLMIFLHIITIIGDWRFEYDK